MRHCNVHSNRGLHIKQNERRVFQSGRRGVRFVLIVVEMLGLGFSGLQAEGCIDSAGLDAEAAG